jgi:hypothetical protein
LLIRRSVCIRWWAAAQAPLEDPYTEQLEARVRALENEIKLMRESLGGEIKCLREALPRTTEALTKAAKAGADISSQSTTTTTDNSDDDDDGSSDDGSDAPGANPSSVEDKAIAALQEAFRLVAGVTSTLLQERSARHAFESSVRVGDDPRRHGITQDEAEYRVMVDKERFEEKRGVLPGMVASTKERIGELQKKAGGDGELSGTVDPDDPATAIRKVYCLLDEFELAATEYKYEGESTGSKVTELLMERKAKLRHDLEWSKVRLRRAQQALQKARGPSSSPQGTSRLPGTRIAR